MGPQRAPGPRAHRARGVRAPASRLLPAPANRARWGASTFGPPPGGERLRPDPSEGEREDSRGPRVQPCGIVDSDQDRALVRARPEERENCGRQRAATIPRRGSVSEHRFDDAGVNRTNPAERLVGDAREQVREAREGQRRLALGGSGMEHEESGRSRALHPIRQQRGLADAGRPREDEGADRPGRTLEVDEPRDPGAFTFSAEGRACPRLLHRVHPGILRRATARGNPRCSDLPLFDPRRGRRRGRARARAGA